jgi:hypothetical protein
VIVDAYSHVCPGRLPGAINERHPSSGVAALRKNSYLFDGERRLRYMDRIGVDQQVLVLVLVRPPRWLGMPRPAIHELTRVASDSIAEMAAADWPVEVLDTIRSLNLSSADTELLLGANLHRIMRL